MKKSAMGLAVLAALSGLSGCATQGPREEITFTLPRGEEHTIVAYGQPAPNWLMSVDEWKMSYLVKNKPTDEQKKAVEIIQQACRKYAKVTQPHVLAEIAANGTLMAAFSAVGVGLGAKEFLNPRATVGSDYYGYGASAGAATGSASGVIAGGSRVYTVKECFLAVANSNTQYGIRPLR